MHELYWVPRKGDPTPRFMSFDDKGMRSQITPSRVKNWKGALLFKFPENEKNNLRMVDIKEPWHTELPFKKSEKKASEEVILKESSPVDDSDRTPITREELIEVLTNNGIAFRRNQKTQTLYEKLPDDIARNFKLSESSVEVQT